MTSRKRKTLKKFVSRVSQDFRTLTSEKLYDLIDSFFGWGAMKSGFEVSDESETVIAFDDLTRTFSIDLIDPTVPTVYFFENGEYWLRERKEVTIPDTEGLHVIYFDDLDLETTPNPTEEELKEIITRKAMVSYIYWDAVSKQGIMFGEERHGAEWNPSIHYWSNEAFNGIIKNGGQLTGIAENGSTFGVRSGVMLHEDWRHDMPTVSSSDIVPMLWLSTASHYPRLEDVGTARTIAKYNDLTTGSQVFVTPDYFSFTHVFWTNCKLNPVVLVMGIAEYETKDIALQSLSAEIEAIKLEFPYLTYAVLSSVLFKSGVGVEPIDDVNMYVDWRNPFHHTPKYNGWNVSVESGDPLLIESGNLIDIEGSGNVVISRNGGVITIDDTHAHPYDNYAQWKLQAEGGTTTDISANETVNFTGTNIAVTRNGNEININATNLVHTHPYDNYANWLLQAEGGATTSIGSGGAVNFSGSGGAVITRIGSTINVDTTHNHSGTYDNYSNWKLQAEDGASADISAGQTVIIRGTDIVVSRIGNEITLDASALVHSHPYDNYGGWVVKAEGETGLQIASGDYVDFTGTNIVISRSGNEVHFDASALVHSHPYDNYSNWKLQVEGGTPTDISTGQTVNVTGTGVVVSRSGNEINIDGTHNHDSEYAPLSLSTITQANHGFSIGQAIRHNGTIYVLAIANSIINAPVVGIVEEVVDANNFRMAVDGYISGAWVAGTDYFLSPTVAGAIIPEPLTWNVGEVRICLGYGTTEGLKVEIDVGDEIVAVDGIGIEGKSAYQIWIDLGNTGTEQDFINTLKYDGEVITLQSVTGSGNGNITFTLTDAGDIVFDASHTHNYDLYSNWLLQANGGASVSVASGDAVNFTGTGEVTVSRSGNTITIDSPVAIDTYLESVVGSGNGNVTLTLNDTNTILWDATHTHNYDNYNYWNLQAEGGVVAAIASGGAVNFTGTNLTVSRSGNEINIDASDLIHSHPYDNYSSWSLQAEGGTSVAISSGGTVNVTGTNIVVTRSGNEINLDASALIHTHPYDNYASWNLQAEGNPSTAILSGGAVNFTGTNGAVITRSGNTINVDIDLDYSGAFDNYQNWELQINGGTLYPVTSGTNVNFVEGSRIGLSQTGTTITISGDQPVWTDISGKPSTFPPDSHTHDSRYYTESEINTFLSAKANVSHTHSYDNYSGWDLQVNSGTTQRVYSGNDVNIIEGSRINISRSGTNVTISGDPTTWADVTGKPSTYPPSTHTHGYDNYGSWDLDVGGINKLSVGSGDYVNFTGGTGISVTYNDPSEVNISSTLTWSTLTGKPSTFTPSTHYHDDRYYTESEVDSLISTAGYWQTRTGLAWFTCLEPKSNYGIVSKNAVIAYGDSYFALNTSYQIGSPSGFRAIESTASGSAYISRNSTGFNFSISKEVSVPFGTYLTFYSMTLHRSDGGLRAPNFVLSSEREKKQNIQDIKGLEKFDNVEFHQFEMKDTPEDLRYGVIVDEIEVLFPNLVRGEEGDKSVKYIDLLVGMVARLTDRVKQLESEVNLLNVKQ